MRKILFSILYSWVQQILFALPPKKRADARNICLVYKPDAIGDFILASGALRELFKASAHRWTLITAPTVETFAKEQFPELDVVVMTGAYEQGVFRSWNRMRSLRKFTKIHNVDTLICLRHVRNGFDQVILNWLSPRKSFGCIDAPISPELPGRVSFYTFTNTIPYPKTSMNGLPLEIEAHRVLLESYLDCSELDLTPRLKHQAPPPQTTPYLLVFPATRSVLRNYPLDKFAAALDMSTPETPLPEILVMGLTEERESMRLFAEKLPKRHQVRLLHPDSLKDLMTWIQHAQAVFSMDSAPAHFAIVFNRPGVFILAGGQWGHFAPWQTRPEQLWLYTQPPCRMCNWICPFEQPHCITEISPATVASAMRSALMDYNSTYP